MPQKSAQAAFSFSVSSASATTISSGSQEIDVTLVINSLPSESYFRVALQKPSGGSYLGYVKNNNGDWSAIQALSGDCTIYYRVSDLSTTLLTLKFKIGDDTLMENIVYKLKGHRFTKTCTSNTDATNSLDIAVNLPTPTPTPVPTLSQANSTPTPTPKPSISSTPTPKVSVTPSVSPTPVKKASSSAATSKIGIDSSNRVLNKRPTPVKKEQYVLSAQDNKLPIILSLTFGILFMAFAGMYFGRDYIRAMFKRN